MSTSLRKRARKDSQSQSDSADDNGSAIMEVDRKPTPSEASLFRSSTVTELSNNSYELKVKRRLEESGDGSHSDATVLSPQDEASSSKKRKMNIIYSRRKREKKKRQIEALSQKSIDLQRENIRLKNEEQKLEALLQSALQMATEYEMSRLRSQSDFSNLLSSQIAGRLSQQTGFQDNALLNNSISSTTTTNPNRRSYGLLPDNLFPPRSSNSPIETLLLSSATAASASASHQLSESIGYRQFLASLQPRGGPPILQHPDDARILSSLSSVQPSVPNYPLTGTFRNYSNDTVVLNQMTNQQLHQSNPQLNLLHRLHQHHHLQPSGWNSEAYRNLIDLSRMTTPSTSTTLASNMNPRNTLLPLSNMIDIVRPSSDRILLSPGITDRSVMTSRTSLGHDVPNAGPLLNSLLLGRLQDFHLPDPMSKTDDDDVLLQQQQQHYRYYSR